MSRSGAGAGFSTEALQVWARHLQGRHSQLMGRGAQDLLYGDRQPVPRHVTDESRPPKTLAGRLLELAPTGARAEYYTDSSDLPVDRLDLLAGATVADPGLAGAHYRAHICLLPRTRDDFGEYLAYHAAGATGKPVQITHLYRGVNMDRAVAASNAFTVRKLRDGAGLADGGNPEITAEKVTEVVKHWTRAIKPSALDNPAS